VCVWGVLRMFCDCFGCFWVFFGVFGCFGVFWGIFGCFWMFLGVFECFWMFLGVFGCFWCFCNSIYDTEYLYFIYDTIYMILDTWYLIFVSWYLQVDIWYLISDTWYLKLAIWYYLTGIESRETRVLTSAPSTLFWTLSISPGIDHNINHDQALDPGIAPDTVEGYSRPSSIAPVVTAYPLNNYWSPEWPDWPIRMQNQGVV